MTGLWAHRRGCISYTRTGHHPRPGQNTTLQNTHVHNVGHLHTRAHKLNSIQLSSNHTCIQHTGALHMHVCTLTYSTCVNNHAMHNGHKYTPHTRHISHLTHTAWDNDRLLLEKWVGTSCVITITVTILSHTLYYTHCTLQKLVELNSSFFRAWGELFFLTSAKPSPCKCAAFPQPARSLRSQDCQPEESDER